MDWEMYFYVTAFILLSLVTTLQVTLNNSDHTVVTSSILILLPCTGLTKTSGENPAPQQFVMARRTLKAGMGFYNLVYGNLGSRGAHQPADHACPSPLSSALQLRLSSNRGHH